MIKVGQMELTNARVETAVRNSLSTSSVVTRAASDRSVPRAAPAHASPGRKMASQ